MRILRWVALSGVCVVSLYLAAATGLALSPVPKFAHPPLSIPGAPARSAPAAPCGAAGIRCFVARDGAVPGARLEEPKVSRPDLVILFLHGVLASSAQHRDTARMLRDSTGALVVSLDLRGHGLSASSTGNRADIAYIGQ